MLFWRINLHNYYLLFVIFNLISYNNILLFKKTNIVDLVWRRSFNEPFLFNYYFIWTNFWYIFILLSIIIFYFFIDKKNSLLFFLNLLLFYFTLIYYLDFYYLNFYNLKFSFFNKYLNPLLLNKFNKIHPFFFYLTIILICYNFLSKKKYNFKKNIILPFYTIAISLLLGAWWAFQEGSWGGWWNWDSSEMLGLIILIYTMYLFHFLPKLNLKFFTKKLSILFIVFLYLCYLLLQLNFSISSHNFNNIVKGNYLYKSYIFLLLIIQYLIILKLIYNITFNIVFYLCFYNFKKNFENYKRNFFFWFKIFLIFLVSLLVLKSYSVILYNFTFFVNNIFNVNWLSYQQILIFLILFYFIFNLNYLFFLTLIKSYLIVNFNFFFPFLICKVRNKFFFLHFFFFILFFLNLNLYFYNNFIYHNITYLKININGYFFYYNYWNITLDNSYYFLTKQLFINNDFVNYTLTSNNFWRKASNIKFSLPWSYDYVWQFFLKPFKIKYLIMFTENNSNFFIILIFFIILNIYFFLNKTKLIIV
uniref:Ccmf n=1 Tax=Strombidium sp. TaxID=181122 RepID=A0A7T0M4J7_9SPIT|nr:ccmf [Strombidium sp.]